MSEPSCASCENSCKNTGCPYWPCTVVTQCDDGSFCKVITGICRHYDERWEKCGATMTHNEPGCPDRVFRCTKSKGHLGLHGQFPTNGNSGYWSWTHAECDSAPELCGAECQGYSETCAKFKNHTGDHHFPKDGHLIVWSYPTPTAFDKAWEENWQGVEGAVLEPGPVPPAYKYHFRAGWQARGKAVNSELQACDARREFGRDGSDDKYLGYSRAICQATHTNKALDAGNECK